MNETKIRGQVFVGTDKGIKSFDWVEIDGRAWIVALGIASHDGKSVLPVRLIAPRAAQGFSIPQGPEMLAIFQGLQVPTSLLEQGVIPHELAKVVEVRENRDIQPPEHEALH